MVEFIVELVPEMKNLVFIIRVVKVVIVVEIVE